MFQKTGRFKVSDKTPCALDEQLVRWRLERRLAWYGLSELHVAGIRREGTETLIATIADTGGASMREGYDATTGRLLWRDSAVAVGLAAA